jgi:hypothetical protein
MKMKEVIEEAAEEVAVVKLTIKEVAEGQMLRQPSRRPRKISPPYEVTDL